MTTYIQATKNDLKQVAKLMAIAFSDYPFMSHSFFTHNFKTKKEKLVFLEKMCFVYAKAMFANVKIFISTSKQEFTGVAIFSKIEKMEISSLDLIRGGLIPLLPQLCKKHATSFISAFLREGAVLDNKYMKANVWYLHIFATSPAYRGKQVGTRLMADMLRFIQAQQGESLVTSTNTEMALNFYVKNGFELMEHEQLILHGADKIDKFIIGRKLEVTS